MGISPEQERSLKIVSDSIHLVHREVLELQFLSMMESNMELLNRLNETCESHVVLLQLLVDAGFGMEEGGIGV